jgi:hypothetical protein
MFQFRDAVCLLVGARHNAMPVFDIPAYVFSQPFRRCTVEHSISKRFIPTGSIKPFNQFKYLYSVTHHFAPNKSRLFHERKGRNDKS